ncbi:MAG: hypothetical protein KF871_06025 [Hydrogenophaga sp.]|uniref:hypothetical protein n=1 Tax=Hydrogenophaga sp. TaxID=1904254 RepID=UPI001DF62D90|nr:hypothetical protein [Hydrogenophaga sp.]MBX3609437.1 hypothetical protein [Hydrogenophaga sp.]
MTPSREIASQWDSRRLPTHSAKRLLAMSLCATLTACGGGRKSDTTAPATLAEQIQQLEASGKLPQLDRSDDIRGPDKDNNGIRDDIDAWIAALPITDAQKRAAQQVARVQQAELLVNLNDQAGLQALGDRSMAGVKCIGDSFKPDYQRGLDLSAQLESMMANTKNRALQYLAYNRARSGSVTELPSGNTCEP